MLRALLVATLAVALFAGCASVPQYRPIYDLPGGKTLEVGVVPQVGVGFDAAESALSGAVPGANAWVAYRTPAGFDLFAAGHGGVGFSLTNGAYGGAQFGGSAGVRYRVHQDFLPDMRFAFEVMGDYLQEDFRFVGDGATTRRHLSAIARIPIAQRATGNIWVYTAPTMGISLPLYEDPPHPFFGINEMPIGVVAGITDWLSIVVEGGYLIQLNGGYLGAGAIFTL